MGKQEMEAIKIKFGGDLHSIEANTFINTLLHFNTILQEINKSLNSEKKIEIRIESTEKGSFIVDLSVHYADIVEGVKALFSNSSISYASGISTIALTVFEISKFLRGKNAKSIKRNIEKESVAIENNYGTVKIFQLKPADIYMKNPHVMQAVAQSMKTLEEDENVTSFELTDKIDNKTTSISREEFHELANDEKLNGDDKKELTVFDARLNISSLDLEFKKNWEFYYMGNKIGAKIKDEDFKEIVSKGKRFGKGDILIADITIQQVFNKEVNAFVNKSYTVDLVKEHVDKIDPLTFFNDGVN